MGEGRQLAVRVEHCAKLADDALKAYRALLADAEDWLRSAEQLGVNYVIADARRVLAGVEEFGPVLETVRAGLDDTVAQVGALAEGSPMATAAGVWWPAGHRPGVALGPRYSPGIHDLDDPNPERRFSAKERDAATLLLERDPGLDIRRYATDHGITHAKNPDSIVYRHAQDRGQRVEFKTPKDATSNSVKNALKDGREQVRRGGWVVIDGRPSGLTEQTARHGIGRYLGQIRDPDRAVDFDATVILRDGTVLELRGGRPDVRD